KSQLYGKFEKSIFRLPDLGFDFRVTGPKPRSWPHQKRVHLRNGSVPGMPRVNHRRIERRTGRGVVWRDEGEASRRRHLGVAVCQRQMDGAGGSRQWRRIARKTLSNVEPCAVSVEVRAAAALLQSWP